ncbi:hypothetical protein GALL_187320 [mine drainage metagenome]|uniref:Uncharacterized protein n=1 Tax=mine drainage metagenome TaxID=410659 RepID=A0A1J5RS83_9ZZZZ
MALQIVKPVVSVGDQVLAVRHQEIELPVRGDEFADRREALQPGGRARQLDRLEALRDVAQQVAEGVLGIGLAAGPADRVLARQLQRHHLGNQAVVRESPLLAAALAQEGVGVGERIDRRIVGLPDVGQDQARAHRRTQRLEEGAAGGRLGRLEQPERRPLPIGDTPAVGIVRALSSAQAERAHGLRRYERGAGADSEEFAHLFRLSTDCLSRLCTAIRTQRTS